jgi:hypothetical protein
MRPKGPETPGMRPNAYLKRGGFGGNSGVFSAGSICVCHGSSSSGGFIEERIGATESGVREVEKGLNRPSSKNSRDQEGPRSDH